MRRTRKTHDLVKSDLKIVEWLNANPEVLAPLKSAFEAYWNDIQVVNFKVNRLSYGNTNLSFRIKFPNYDTQFHDQSFILPNFGQRVNVGNYKNIYPHVYKILEGMWESDMPTFNRKMDSWWETINNEVQIYSQWTWLKVSQVVAQTRCQDIVERECLSHDHIEKARELEKSFSLERLSRLMEEFQNIKTNDWFELINLAVMQRVHESGKS